MLTLGIGVFICIVGIFLGEALGGPKYARVIKLVWGITSIGLLVIFAALCIPAKGYEEPVATYQLEMRDDGYYLIDNAGESFEYIVEESECCIENDLDTKVRVIESDELVLRVTRKVVTSRIWSLGIADAENIYTFYLPSECVLAME